MKAVYEVPLTASAQIFRIELAFIAYSVQVRWCPPMQAWVCDFMDGAGTPVLMGVPLVTGADLFDQYTYLGFAGQLRVQSLSDPFKIPTLTSLGSDGLLFFIPD